MTKTKSQKLRMKKLRGKGDYDLFDDPPVQKSKSVNKIDSLESRVSRLESRVPKAPSSKVGQLASTAGRVLGSSFGMGDLGEHAGSALAKLFGHGDYSIKTNSLMNGADVMVPKFDNNGKRGVRIREREYLGDVFSGALVSGSSTFTNVSYPINPGVAKTFPWLSTIANQFEEYEPHGIVFEFISTSSEYNGTSQALGTIIAATDYDPDDAAYASKMEMENADYSVSSKAASNLMHGIECDSTERSSRVMYIRSGSVGSQPLKFYDLGNFQLATLGMSAANVNLGELWVSYDITFYKKQVVAGYLGNTTLVSATRSPNASSGVAYGVDKVQVGSLTITFTDNNTFVFPSSLTIGRYLYAHYVYGEGDDAGDAVAQMPTPIAVSGCTIQQCFGPWSSFSDATKLVVQEGGINPNGANYAGSALYILDISAPSATVTTVGLTNLITGSTACVSYLLLTQLPTNTLA